MFLWRTFENKVFVCKCSVNRTATCCRHNVDRRYQYRYFAYRNVLYVNFFYSIITPRLYMSMKKPIFFLLQSLKPATRVQDQMYYRVSMVCDHIWKRCPNVFLTRARIWSHFHGSMSDGTNHVLIGNASVCGCGACKGWSAAIQERLNLSESLEQSVS